MCYRRRLKPVIAGMEMRLEIVGNNNVTEFVKDIVKVLNLNSILSLI
ncbi:hypothetical protein [Clostridium botulinum]|nr:hypothetical protein [Clostridium botulinum]AEB75793.1 putative hypothetical protein [Clostridium botulinum BKT015925]